MKKLNLSHSFNRNQGLPHFYQHIPFIWILITQKKIVGTVILCCLSAITTFGRSRSIVFWDFQLSITCFPHFQSGPRMTRAPTPSIVIRGGRLTTDTPLPETVADVDVEFAFCESICDAAQAI